MIGMIADDLTGACDAGIQFAAVGFCTEVCLDYQAAAVEMNVVTTDSRACSPETACDSVRQACLWMKRNGIRLVYKKIDSTLCGNVEAETGAALDAAGIGSAWICPAFPAMGRTVVDGWLYVRGERCSRVPCSRRIRALDASADEDLARIAAEASCEKSAPLLVGSAGLAVHVARNAAGARPRPAPAPMRRPSRILLAVGSKNPITAAQAQRVRGIDTHYMQWGLADGQALQPVPDAFVLTGGDTARRICEILGVRAIRLEREILTGIPQGWLIGGSADGALVVTKAGGFGDEDALLRIVEFLQPCGRP